MKYIIISIKVFFLIVFVNTLHASFTISAEVERTLIISIDTKTVKEYLENLNIYPKFFPDIDSIKRTSDRESEWSYRVEYPLAEPWTVKFDEIEKDDNDSLILFESIDPSKNYLYCEASFSTPGQNQTSVLFKIKVTLTREKASDIHLLAGILGEKYISNKMRDKLDGDLATFIKNISKDMYHVYKR